MNADTYGKINALIASYSQANAELEGMEAKIKEAQLEAAVFLMPKYAQLKTRLTDFEGKLRALADANYEELFPEEKKRSHKTPFGALSYHKSASLEFEDEEKTVLKIEAACEAELERADAANEDPLFRATELVRVRCSPNIEALELLDDKTLKRFGIERVHKDTFKVKPFEMKTDKPKQSLEPMGEKA